MVWLTALQHEALRPRGPPGTVEEPPRRRHHGRVRSTYYLAQDIADPVRPKPEAPIEIRSEHKEPQVQAIPPAAPAAQQPQEVPAEGY
jgi:hypothetical protein